MKIGIIGAGAIGSTLARAWIQEGHEVALSNSRGPDSLRNLVRELGPRAHAMKVDEAASFGEVVLLSVPFRDPGALPDRRVVEGKIVIDAMNPYQTDGTVETFWPASSSSVETAKRLPGARIVKAFNTIWVEHLKANAKKGAPREQRQSVPVAGDDAEAKGVVCGLIESIGFAAVEAGSLAGSGRLQEPNGAIYNQILTPSEMERIIRDSAERSLKRV